MIEDDDLEAVAARVSTRDFIREHGHDGPAYSLSVQRVDGTLFCISVASLDDLIELIGVLAPVTLSVAVGHDEDAADLLAAIQPCRRSVRKTPTRFLH